VSRTLVLCDCIADVGVDVGCGGGNWYLLRIPPRGTHNKRILLGLYPWPWNFHMRKSLESTWLQTQLGKADLVAS
jgi:hypothetical protein